MRWLTQQPASLFGLGIPPAQYEALCSGSANDMAGVLRQRLEKLACDFDIRQNYFAQQAFGAAMPARRTPPSPSICRRAIIRR